MDFNYNMSLDKAIKICDNQIHHNLFDCVYPFTTENINSYIDNFNLNGKSLLTVGSSGDQIINAILSGCSDITLLDKNPYAKYYYYLKVTCLLCLTLDEFMNFLRFHDYPKVFKNNKDVFSKNTFEKIKPTLRLLDYESYLFWDELFQMFDSFLIRDKLFSSDENRTYVIEKCNRYLLNNILYEETKEKIKRVIPNFIYGDLFEIDLDRNYDNIWLSNIGTYLSEPYIKIMVDKMSLLLNSNGQLLISYLYNHTIDTKYQHDWSFIYDLKKTFVILKEYMPDLISFIGVDGIKFQNDDIKDSILVYRKH